MNEHHFSHRQSLCFRKTARSASPVTRGTIQSLNYFYVISQSNSDAFLLK